LPESIAVPSLAHAALLAPPPAPDPPEADAPPAELPPSAPPPSALSPPVSETLLPHAGTRASALIKRSADLREVAPAGIGDG